MTSSLRAYVSPIAAVITLAIGVGFVAAIRAVSAMFTTPLAVARDAPHSATQKHDFYPVPPVATVEVDVEKLRTELSCYDPQVLPIWHQLKKDEEFKHRVGHSSDSTNCSEMLEVYRVDLNRDGKKEILVRGKNFQVCGAVGNCGFWVFERAGSSFKKLLSSSDYVDISDLGEQIQKSRTKGYADLLLKGHFSAAETGFYTYKFNGRRYVESRCMYEVPKYTRQGEALSEMITCKEFDRRLKKELAGTN